MRSAAFIVLFLLVSAGLLAVLVRQNGDAGVASTRPAAPATRRVVPSTNESGAQSVIGQSSGVRIETRDRETGEIKNEYLFDQLDPRDDGSVDVAHPQAWFYDRTGGVVTLEGTKGNVRYTQAGGRGDPGAVSSATPTSGTLRDVTIAMFDSADEDVPSLTVRVPAMRFDAIDNSVSTVDTEIDGRRLLAEQVPVTVRGRDYEFDGTGLRMRWNDRDGRLEELVIERGERLLVRDVGRFDAELPGATATPRPATRRAADARPSTRRAAPPAPPARKTNAYFATFRNDVRVTRDGQPVAEAERLVVGFTTDGDREGEPAARARPADAPREGPSVATRPAVARRRGRPGAKSAAAELDAARPVRAAASRPATTTAATRPSPLEVRWSGPLVVRPDETPGAAESVTLEGKPARVHDNGAEAVGGRIHVEPATGHVRVEPDESTPAIELAGADGSILRSRSRLVVERDRGRAYVEGGGTLLGPTAEPGESQASVRWSRRLELGLGDDGSWIRLATLEGDAAVEAQDFSMRGGKIQIGLDRPPASTRAATMAAKQSSFDARSLRTVQVDGDARVEAGPVEARRSMAGEQLRLAFAAGEDAPLLAGVDGRGGVAMIDADGTAFSSQVLHVAFDPIAIPVATQPSTRRASSVAATSRPTTAPVDLLAQVRELLATGDVALRRADGGAIAGNRLALADLPAGRRLVIEGAPARASSRDGALVATRILVDPATEQMDVPVAGRIVATGDSPGEITWSDSLHLDAVAGECLFEGGVRVRASGQNGSTFDAAAARATATFDPDAVRARPLDAPATPATRPTTRSIGESLRAIHLIDDVKLNVDSPDGRSAELVTKLIDVDVATNHLRAPQPGQMLMRGAPVPTSRPTTGPTSEPTPAAATAPASAPASEPSTQPAARRGNMAVAWRGALDWQLDAGKLTLDDGVRIGYERVTNDPPVRIDARRLVGTLTQIDLSKQSPAAVELRAIHLEGSVRVRSAKASFDSSTLDYDLANATATARGDAGRDVQVLDSTGRSRLSFSSILWNVETGDIQDFRDISVRVRR